MENEQKLKSRILWQCRRGMLELELILLSYVNKGFEQLSDTQRELFIRLLEYPDPVLYNWLLGYEKASDPTLQEFIEGLRQEYSANYQIDQN